MKTHLRYWLIIGLIIVIPLVWATHTIYEDFWIESGRDFTIGTTQWNTGDDLDPDVIAGDTSDDDLIDAAVIDSAMTRDTEWDSLTEIETATSKDIVDTTEIDSEAELEALLADVTNVYTNTDGALNDDDVTLADVQSACTSDFHNIGGTDDERTQEEIDDFVDALLNDADSVHTRITITYDDTDNAMDFIVDDMNDDVPEAGDFGAATDLDANGALNTNSVADNEIDYTAVNMDDMTDGSTNAAITLAQETSYDAVVTADPSDYDEYSDLPVATVTDNDTTHIPNCENVYEFCETTQDYQKSAEINTEAELEAIWAAYNIYTSDDAEPGLWNTAYGWGDHSGAGYLTGNETITLTGDVSGSGATAITTTIGANKILNTMIAAAEVYDSDLNTGTGANQINTADIPEQTNLYYTEARVSANTDVAANTAKVTESTTATSPLVKTTYDLSIPAATNAAAGHATAAHITALEANTAKETNVPTALSVGTVGVDTVAITSDGGADDVTLPAATVTTAGMLTTAKWGEIVANTAKVTNATHTGDVTGATALTIGADKILNTMVAADEIYDMDINWGSGANQVDIDDMPNSATYHRILAPTAAGDMLYSADGSTWIKLPKGTEDHVLTMTATIPNWEVAAAGAANHNDLGGLQGGQTDQYYHATAAEYTKLQNLVATKKNIIMTTRAMNAASGTVDYTGFGFQPNLVFIFAAVNGNKAACWGTTIGTVTSEMAQNYTGTMEHSTSRIADIFTGVGNEQVAVFSAWLADGIRLGWTKFGVDTSTIRLTLIGLKL